MDVQNFTPFPAVAWESVDADKQWYISTLVRVKYRLLPSDIASCWELRLTPEQGEFFSEDIYFDNDTTQSVRYESDFVTYKQHTDIIVNATSYSPNGLPSKEWHCGVQVISPQNKVLINTSLQALGASQWEKLNMVGWTQTGVKEVKSVPIRYTHAYGGCIVNPDAEGFGDDYYLVEDTCNPVGTGVRHKKMSFDNFPAHQIEWQNKSLSNNSYPAGFGIINRTWSQRLQYAGTYDQAWIDHQHPYPPHDFNVRHHQAANPELILKGYIEMGSEIQLNNLLSETNLCRFKLPELYCFSEFITENDHLQRKLMPIDTVLIDLEGEEKVVYLSYRYFMPKITDPKAIHFCYLPKEQLEKQS